METYTVFAVYEDDNEPFSTTVRAGTPKAAMGVAQAVADDGNGTHFQLAGFQVVLGRVRVIA